MNPLFLLSALSSVSLVESEPSLCYDKIEMFMQNVNLCDWWIDSECLFIVNLTRNSRDCFLFLRFRRTLRHIWGKLVGLPGPNNRENLNTLSGRKSGNSSRTSTFAYFEGSIAANGVSNFFSPCLSSPPSDFVESVLFKHKKLFNFIRPYYEFCDVYLIWDLNGKLGGGINSVSLSVDFFEPSDSDRFDFVSILTLLAGIASSISS